MVLVKRALVFAGGQEGCDTAERRCCSSGRGGSFDPRLAAPRRAAEHQQTRSSRLEEAERPVTEFPPRILAVQICFSKHTAVRSSSKGGKLGIR